MNQCNCTQCNTLSITSDPNPQNSSFTCNSSLQKLSSIKKCATVVPGDLEFRIKNATCNPSCETRVPKELLLFPHKDLRTPRNFLSLFLSSSQSNSLSILKTLHQNGSTGVGRGCLANLGVEIGVRGVVEMWQIGVSWWRWLLGLVQWWVVVLVARLGSCVCFKFR